MRTREPPSPGGVPFSQEGVVLHDLTSGAWVVDVTDCGPDLDREHIQFDQDAVLVCFGEHAPRECALSAAPPPGVPHGVVFEVSPDSRSAANYVQRFGELTSAAHPSNVNVRSRH